MRSLYAKLALALFVLLLAVGLVTGNAFQRWSDAYRQAAVQELNRDLARYIVDHHQPLISGRRLNQPALAALFDDLMAVNPAIEVYLLDPDGRILSYSAPPERVRIDRVRLAPIRAFLYGPAVFPLPGDDPRHPDRPAVFSVAPIAEPGGTAGYLYVVLTGEGTVAALDRVAGGRSLREGWWLVGGALAAALIGGLLLFAWIARRLGRLARAMTDYGDGPDPSGATARSRRAHTPGRWPDAIDRLGETFDAMAERIDRQLESLARNDATRRELVANVSHDLRTPLTALHGHLETLAVKDASLSQAERREVLRAALGSGERLQKLVTDLFELARLEAVESPSRTEPIHLGELMQDVAQHHERRAREQRIELAVRFDDRVPWIEADIGMIERLLENLIENALRHTPAGGTVTLAARVEGAHVVLEVSDTGPGVPEAERDRIFERLRTGDTARSAGGSGLGLAIVRRIARLHGGSVRVGDTPGGGACFRVTLPAPRASLPSSR